MVFLKAPQHSGRQILILGVEHIVTNPSLGAGSPQVAFATSLATRFTGASSPLDGVIGISLSTMNATKASDLADPTTTKRQLIV